MICRSVIDKLRLRAGSGDCALACGLEFEVVAVRSDSSWVSGGVIGESVGLVGTNGDTGTPAAGAAQQRASMATLGTAIMREREMGVRMAE